MRDAQEGEGPGDHEGWGVKSGQPQGLEGDGHSLHFGFAAGLTLEADVICGEDDHTPGRLLRDDGGFHHWGRRGDRRSEHFGPHPCPMRTEARSGA